MADDGLREKLRHGLPFVHWQSIESALTGGGIPDLNGCYNGVDAWVECKKTDGWTCGDVKVFQVSWALQRLRSGGRVVLATRRRTEAGPRKGKAVDELWLHSGAYMYECRKGGLRGAPTLLVTGGGPANWDWEAVQRVVFFTSLAR